MPHSPEVQFKIDGAIRSAKRAQDLLASYEAHANDVLYALNYLRDNPDVPEQEELDTWLGEAAWAEQRVNAADEARWLSNV